MPAHARKSLPADNPVYRTTLYLITVNEKLDRGMMSVFTVLRVVFSVLVY